MKLHELRPAKGANKKRRRVGRGIAAGQGKTAGRGTKGQNARSGGGVRPYFEGGQLPLVRRLPQKRGFTNIFKVYYTPVNLDRLDDFAAGDEVSPATLAEAGLIKSAREPVAILGRGELDRPLTVKAHRFSASACEKIQAAGGSAEVLSR
jgi:large subunit ribosomal protein L15